MSVLTTHGYAILKSSLTKEKEDKIKQDLTVKPQTLQRFAAPVDNDFPVFLESATRLYLPRVWAKDNLGPPESSVMSDGIPLPPELKFAGKPYDYQENIISKFMKADANGLICVPCGKGKTFMALAIAFRLGARLW
jgi:CRISPR/Cas system-associated endonuclease/helicase Cas3